MLVDTMQPSLGGLLTHLLMCVQAHLLMMVDKPGADLRMPGGLMEAAHRTWLVSARNVRVSALHREVSRLLGERGVPHTIEHLTDDQLFSVDIALAGQLSCPSFIKVSLLQLLYLVPESSHSCSTCACRPEPCAFSPSALCLVHSVHARVEGACCLQCMSLGEQRAAHTAC